MAKSTNLLLAISLIGSLFCLATDSDNAAREQYDNKFVQVLDACTPGFHAPKHLLKPQDFLPCAEALKTLSIAYEALSKEKQESEFRSYSRLCAMVDAKFKASEINIEAVAKAAVEAGIITQEEYNTKKAEFRNLSMDLRK
jgi:hypothetical protein